MLSTDDKVQAFLAADGEIFSREWLDEDGRALPSAEGASMLRLHKRLAGGRTLYVRVDASDARFSPETGT